MVRTAWRIDSNQTNCLTIDDHILYYGYGMCFCATWRKTQTADTKCLTTN
jgi:hypothetical protein